MDAKLDTYLRQAEARHEDDQEDSREDRREDGEEDSREEGGRQEVSAEGLTVPPGARVDLVAPGPDEAAHDVVGEGLSTESR